jgi:hypothetical protein
MSNVIAIQQFLIDKRFRIPSYQRDYSWTLEEVAALLEDIDETLQGPSGQHFLGTVVLAKNADRYEIVDGQQRLTTLMLLVHALLQQLPDADHDRIANEVILLRDGHELKLDFGTNAAFVADLFGDGEQAPTTAGQRKLADAYRFAFGRAQAIAMNAGAEGIKSWLKIVKSLEVIEFIAPDVGRAIRLFQTVNDRGLPLTVTDKTKALLVLYSNRDLGGNLDDEINHCFGTMFAAFDGIRELVREPGFAIDNITRRDFVEDDVIRYHYLAYSNPYVQAGDYEGALRTVFDAFLKHGLKTLRQDHDRLRAFIHDYVTDLREFAIAFRGVIEAVRTDPRLYKSFVVLGLSARLYPLVIRLYQRGLLFAQAGGPDLLQCLEVCDVRVYKTRGTDPARDIGDLSHRSRTANVGEIAAALKTFIESFQPDGLFEVNLSTGNTYRNDAALLWLLAYDETISGETNSIARLRNFSQTGPTREHIVVQTPDFDVTACGFANESDYQAHLHRLGNLTLLTRAENSRCNNQPVHSKMTDPRFYPASVYPMTRALVHEYAEGGSRFGKAELNARTQKLKDFVLSHWKVW